MYHKVIVKDESLEGTVHMQVITIGFDLAKNVFHVHGVDANDKVLFSRSLRRSQVHRLEASTSAAQWLRKRLRAYRRGKCTCGAQTNVTLCQATTRIRANKRG